MRTRFTRRTTTGRGPGGLASSARRVAGLSLLLALPLAGCTTWRAQQPPAAGARPATRPVRVTLLGGRLLVLERAAVQGDSLVGEEGRPPRRRAVALREVVRVEGRRVSALRTLGLYYAVSQVVGLVVLAVVWNTWD